jgi:hypothetical protein
MPFIPGIDKSM